ncbi:hypothetical protein FFI16_024270 [Pseudomonas sp. KBS0710]|nr:hypothetical protein FFI16_024270 [Pseudomonas sp. KBS0710]
MDNFMEQPTYKMNRGAILAQGYGTLVEGVTEDEGHSSESTEEQMWERACSRMRSDSHRRYRLIHRIRGQARSHIKHPDL